MLKPNELAEQIKKAGKTQRIVEFQCPYIPDFYVSLAFCNRFVLNQIRETAREVYTNPRTRVQEERFNDTKIRTSYAEQIIQEWKGLTGEKLQRLIPGLELKEEDGKPIDLKREISFSTIIAVTLLSESIEFENWVYDIAGNIDNYSPIAKQKKLEKENLS